MYSSYTRSQMYRIGRMMPPGGTINIINTINTIHTAVYSSCVPGNQQLFREFYHFRQTVTQVSRVSYDMCLYQHVVFRNMVN